MVELILFAFAKHSSIFFEVWIFSAYLWKIIFLSTVIAHFAVGISRHYDCEIELAMNVGFPFYLYSIIYTMQSSIGKNSMVDGSFFHISFIYEIRHLYNKAVN